MFNGTNKFSDCISETKHIPKLTPPKENQSDQLKSWTLRLDWTSQNFFSGNGFVSTSANWLWDKVNSRLNLK